MIGYTLRGVVAHNDKNREGAVAAFEHVLEVDPDLRLMPLPHQTFWSYLAEDLIKIGRTDEAGRDLTRVLDETPDAPQHGLLDEAERCFQQAAEWEPDNYLPRYSLGKIELQRHRLEAARQHLEAARQLAPRQVDVLHSLVTVYRLLGNRRTRTASIRPLARSVNVPCQPGTRRIPGRGTHSDWHRCPREE